MARTVKPEAVGFYETRLAPDMKGELASGPTLCLYRFHANVFREFIYEKLAVS